MIESINKTIGYVSGLVWGWPMLILLVGTGLYLTILLKGMQFWALPHAFGLIFKKDASGEGDISHFAALMTALAATVGNGNIVGVATAISIGGPGAVFWMWVTGLVGMATKYAEAILAVKYREAGPQGMRGGPMYYIAKGAGMPWLGWLFALFAAIAAFGIGNMVQADSVVANFKETFDIPPLYTGAVLMVLTGLVIIGGIRWIGRFTSVLVPVMIVGYCGAALLILVINIKEIPRAFGLIFEHAFSPLAAGGGVAGATIAQAIRYGVARGVFSNESGLGSSPIAAAAARTKDPATQALVSMTQTFIDTLVVCTMTALVILTALPWTEGVDTATLTAASFSQTLGGAGGIIVALASAVFAYSTLLGWCYYGEKSIEFLAGPRAIKAYRLIFVLAIFLGSIFQVDSIKQSAGLIGGKDIVWNFSDMMNGMMAAPNLVGLLLLSLAVRRETKQYFGRLRGPVAPKGA